jgi:hypothetical protein
VRAGAQTAATIQVQLDTDYHVNTNTPSDDYLIPLRLTWEAAPLEVASIEYPKGRLERYQFSSKPLSVYTGDFALVTRFRAPPGSPAGSRKITGKLRYQACTQTTCYPPKTVTFELPVEIR